MGSGKSSGDTRAIDSLYRGVAEPMHLAMSNGPNQDSHQKLNVRIHGSALAVVPDHPDPPLLPDPEVELDRLTVRLSGKPSSEGGAGRGALHYLSGAPVDYHWFHRGKVVKRECRRTRRGKDKIAIRREAMNLHPGKPGNHGVVGDPPNAGGSRRRVRLGQILPIRGRHHEDTGVALGLGRCGVSPVVPDGSRCSVQYPGIARVVDAIDICHYHAI